MVNILENLLEVREATDARSSCRVCGERINSGEPSIRLHYMVEQVGYWRHSTPTRRYRSVHLSCWLTRDTGRQFIMGVLDRLTDEEILALGLFVAHPADDEAPAEVREFRVGDIVEPREPGVECAFGNSFGEGWAGEVRTAPFRRSHDGRISMEIVWTRGRSGHRWTVSPDEMRLVTPEPAPEPEPEPDLTLRVGAQVRMLRSVMGFFNEGETYTIVQEQRGSTSSWGIAEHGASMDCGHLNRERPGFYWLPESAFEVVG